MYNGIYTCTTGVYTCTTGISTCTTSISTSTTGISTCRHGPVEEIYKKKLATKYPHDFIAA